MGAYPLLYHDMKERLLIQVFNAAWPYSDQSRRMLDAIVPAAQTALFAQQGYRMRIVFDFADLAEKVAILEAGLDDRAIEWIKAVMVADFRKKTGEPWATQHFLTTYGDMWIFKAALEAAGKADRAAVATALRAMNLSDGPARFFPGGRMKFDESGRREGAGLLIVQWQNGIPVTVYPPREAVAAPIWPKH